jgi:hypothetical protein
LLAMFSDTQNVKLSAPMRMGSGHPKALSAI